MKKIFILGVLCVLWYGVVLSYPNEPDGFRQIKWQATKQSLGKLKIQESYGAYAIYLRDGDSLEFFGMPATKILYGFTGDYLETVDVQFAPCSAQCHEQLKQKLFALYGPGELLEGKEVIWRGDKTNIKLGIYGEGSNVYFSDNAIQDKREKLIDAFVARFNAKRSELLAQYDAPVVAEKIKAWLAQEGTELIDTFNVDKIGEQISIHFKGSGTMIFSASPVNAQQQVASSKVYTVEEALAILQNNPEEFRGKDILLRLAIVDGIGGSGCSDLSIFTDAKYVALYQKKYRQDLTPEEKQAVKDIPLISSGPDGDFPSGLFSEVGREAVARGHFFDQGMKPCADGWKRFVITGKGDDK